MGLRQVLEEVYRKFNKQEFLCTDPLGLVLERPRTDIEASALVAALLAYGHVKQIRFSVSNALARMDGAAGSATGFADLCTAPRAVKPAKALSGFVHRFNTGDDIVLLMCLLGLSRRKYGSLGGHFATYARPDDRNTGQALSMMLRDWSSWACASALPRGRFFAHLLASPEHASCCKRWCMLLRWMCRRDRIDPGPWLAPEGPGAVKPSQLVIPLDTHVARISRSLGLTARKNADWTAALEVTRALGNIDPDDPVRFDFALARIGIVGDKKLEAGLGQHVAI